MSQEWSTLLKNVTVTMDSGIAAGTIRSHRGGIKYKATGLYGLVPAGDRTYRIAQLYQRSTGRVSSGTYARVNNTNDAHVSCNISTTAYVKTGTLSNGQQVSYNGIPAALRLASPHSSKPVDTNLLYCKGSLLYQKVSGATSSSSITWQPNAYYYRSSGPRVTTYNSYTTYKTKTRAAANAWKAIIEGRSGSSSGVGSSSPNDAYDGLTSGGGIGLSSAGFEAAITASLNTDPEWRAAISVRGNRDRNGDPLWAGLRNLATKVLKAKGWNDAMITWFLNLKTGNSSGSSTSGGGQSRGPGSSTSTPINNKPIPTVAPTPASVKVVVRAPFGYAKPPTKPRSQKPMIVQNYVDYVRDTSSPTGYKAVNGQDMFVFTHVPNQISYSGLGSEWQQIDRQGNYPVVEWAKWQLMKVDIDFLIAEDRVDGSTTVPDGIFTSVQSRINVLRRMAQRRAAVSVFNLDDLFRVQVKRAARTGKAMEFVIADMTVNSTRRAMESNEKAITAASIKLTLQEIPIENVSLVKMSPPQISLPKIPPPTNQNDVEVELPLETDGFVIWKPT